MMSSSALTPKIVRSAYDNVREAEAEVTRQAALLHRLYYKSKAQHRSAKWFQSLDGIRKCVRRLLDARQGGSGDGQSSDRGRRHTTAVQVEGSLPNRAGRKDRRAGLERSRRDPGEQDVNVVDAALYSLIDLWCGLWGEERQRRSSLPKFDREPTAQPSMHVVRQSAMHLLLLACVLEELSFRAKLAFSMLTAQLRTPPAPTFAPLTATLLPLTAAIDELARRTLWGNVAPVQGTGQLAALAHFYNHLGRMYDQPSTKPFSLDAHSQHNKAKWRHMLNAVQACNTANLSWMPSVLLEPTSDMGVEMRRTDEQKGIPPVEAEDSDAARFDEEDIGETIA